MMFFQDVQCQKIKSGHIVCGDYVTCERHAESTILLICDGIGSGVYANISAITCANRILEHFHCGTSLRSISEMIASSMHRARKEDIPFSAFSVAQIYADGKFTVYTYEAPEALLVQNGSAIVLKPQFLNAGYEVIGETHGVLYEGDSLVLSSDGVTQAGLGHGYGFGIGSEGIANYINRNKLYDAAIETLPMRLIDYCVELSDGLYEDDITMALVHCRKAEELTILTGPPSKHSMDKTYVKDFLNMTGRKIVCGSSTAELVAREMGKDVEVVKLSSSFGSPPEYRIEGIDLTTEGAVTLNQVYNILGEPLEDLMGDTTVERLCILLMQTDIVHLMIGNAVNDAHESLLFKQVGVRIRKNAIRLLAEKLRKMGKLVTEKYD